MSTSMSSIGMSTEEQSISATVVSELGSAVTRGTGLKGLDLKK